MFKIGKVTNYYENIGVTVVALTGNLAVGDVIKIYKDGEEILEQKIDEILLNQKSVVSADRHDVIALHLNAKIKKESEVYKISLLGVRPSN